MIIFVNHCCVDDTAQKSRIQIAESIWVVNPPKSWCEGKNKYSHTHSTHIGLCTPVCDVTHADSFVANRVEIMGQTEREREGETEGEIVVARRECRKKMDALLPHRIDCAVRNVFGTLCINIKSVCVHRFIASIYIIQWKKCWWSMKMHLHKNMNAESGRRSIDSSVAKLLRFFVPRISLASASSTRYPILSHLSDRKPTRAKRKRVKWPPAEWMSPNILDVFHFFYFRELRVCLFWILNGVHIVTIAEDAHTYTLLSSWCSTT